MPRTRTQKATRVDPTERFREIAPNNFESFQRPRIAKWVYDAIAKSHTASEAFLKLVKDGCVAEELFSDVAEIRRWPLVKHTKQRGRNAERLANLAESIQQCSTTAASLDRDGVTTDRFGDPESEHGLEALAKTLAGVAAELKQVHRAYISLTLGNARAFSLFILVEHIKHRTGRAHFSQIAELLNTIDPESETDVRKAWRDFTAWLRRHKVLDVYRRWVVETLAPPAPKKRTNST